MQIVVLYVTTAVLFLAIDAVMLSRVMRPLFERHVGELMLDSPKLGPAALFYMAFVGAVVWLVSLPALREGDPMRALFNGAILGAAAYGTYEFTNLATLKGWSWQQVTADTLWGAVLTGGTAAIGVWAARAVG
jgi:uncharacterized membrane protein